jgi:putative oxidoreductase
VNRYAPKLLWVALAAQSGWVAVNELSLHRSPRLDVVGGSVLAVLAAFAIMNRLWRWPTVVVRILMAIEFLLAIADRFGLLGAPGTSMVSWGTFAHFVDYTRSITTFLPGRFAGPLAVAATVIEIGLAAMLLVGARLKIVALSSATLLGIYGISMTATLPIAEQFHYNVFALAAAMLVVAGSRSDRTRTSLHR